jgi:hypothetical protein
LLFGFIHQHLNEDAGHPVERLELLSDSGLHLFLEFLESFLHVCFGENGQFQAVIASILNGQFYLLVALLFFQVEER